MTIAKKAGSTTTIPLILIVVVWQCNHTNAQSPTEWKDPARWWSSDIGTTGGNALQNGDTFEITGDGLDIWGKSDSFHFMFKELSGSGSITVRVVSYGTGRNTWSKGGVMIRDDTTSGSAHASMVISGGAGGGATFIRRRGLGAATISFHDPIPTVSPPYWVRVERNGNAFSGFLSSDGLNWQQQGTTQTIDMKNPVYIGLCVTSSVPGSLRTYTFDNINLQGLISGRPEMIASEPSPANGIIHTFTWVNLSWKPGKLATSHNVYFSDDMDKVIKRESATLIARTSASSITVGLPGYAFSGGLGAGITYYWCVDEVSDTSPDSPWEGKVWSFRIWPKVYSSGPAAYLLITRSELANAFQTLVERRTSQGFPGKLVTVWSIYANYPGMDQPEKIRNCIIHHFENYGTQYVAIGGDDTIVPTRYCYTGWDDILPADLYYSDMDGGDWDTDGDRRYGEPEDVGEVELIPDVHLGRIPVRTIEHTKAYVDKVIIYEEASPEDYAGSILLGGSSPNYSPFSGESRPLGFEDHDPVAGGEINVTSWYLEHVKLYAHVLPVHRYFYTNSHWDEQLCGDAPWGPSYLEAHLNEGYQLLLYTAHGHPAGWGMGAGFFRESHAGRLTNPFPCIVIAGGCAVAGFDALEPSLSEAFLRNPNGGAVAFFGFTRSGGHGLSRLELSSELFRDRQTSIGQALTRSRITMTPELVLAPWCQSMFVLLGDPLIHLIPEREGRHLQIFQPKGLETIKRNSDVYIRWNVAGTGFTPYDLIKLEYSADSGKTWYGIQGAEALPYEDRLFIWENCNLPPGREYRIRAVSLSDPDVSDMSDRDFTIGDMVILTVQSIPVKGIPVNISGSMTDYCGILTDFNITILEGATINISAPVIAGESSEFTFVRWKAESGNTITTMSDYTFIITEDKTIVAEYAES